MPNYNQKQKLIILAMVLLTVCSFGSVDLYVPSLPTMSIDLDASAQAVQLTITAYLLGFCLSQLVSGPLSDRFGRRPIVLWSTLITIIACIICTMASNIEIVIFGRIIQGLGIGGAALQARTIMRDVFQGRALIKAGAYLGISTAIAIGVAPIIGGFIEQVSDWRVSFLVMTISSLGLLLFLWWQLPETHNEPDHNALKWPYLKSNFGEVLSNKSFWGYSLCSGLALSALLSYAATAPFILQNSMGLTPFQYGWTVLFITSGQAVGIFLNNKVVDYINPNNAIKLGLAIMLLSSFTLFLIGLQHSLNIWTVLLPMVCFIIGTGFIYFNSFGMAFTQFGHIAGIAAATFGLMQVGWSFISNGVVALIPHKTPITLGVAFMIFSLLAMLSLHFLVSNIFKFKQAESD